MIASVIFYLFLSGVAWGAPLLELESRARGLVESNSFGDLSELVAELKAARVEAGLQNLSVLSGVLLTERNCRENCDFFISLALELSPTDPRISARALMLQPSFTLLFRTLGNLSNSPSLTFSSLVLAMLCALVLGTLGLAVRTVFRVAKMELRGRLSGPSGLVAFLIMAFGCLPLGILPCIASWLLLLGLADYRVRRSAAFLLALSLAWILVLPVGETVITNLKRDSERGLELLLSSVSSSTNYVPLQSSDPIELLAAGTALFHRGEFTLAKEAFASASDIATSRDIDRVAYARLGAAELALREFDAAERSLQRAIALGGASFEILQNLVVAETGRVNLKAQRRYLEQLKTLDEKRFRRESTELAILLQPMPLSVFLLRYLEPPERFMVSAEPVSAGYLRNDLIITPLASTGGIAALTMLSLLSAGLCVFRGRV